MFKIGTLILFILLIFIIGPCSVKNGMKNRIAENYSGVIIDIYSPKKGIDSTHIRIKMTNGYKAISISSDAIAHMQIGDSIDKPSDSMFGTLYKLEGTNLRVPLFNEYTLNKYGSD